MKHIENEKFKREEEEKLSKMNEEKDEYFKIKKLTTIWNKVRFQQICFRLLLKIA